MKLYPILSFILLFGCARESLGVDPRSPCLATVSNMGPHLTSSITFSSIFVASEDLVNIKSVRSVSKSTMGSCAASCTGQRASSIDSCNVYYVMNGICKTGVLDNPQSIAADPTADKTNLVEVKVVLKDKKGNLGTRVIPLGGTMSSTASVASKVSNAWDGKLTDSYATIAYTASVNPFEYIQFDFGTCNLTFIQIVVHAKYDSAADSTMYNNLEVRIGNTKLTDKGLIMTPDPLCGKIKQNPPSIPPWFIVKCRNKLSGQYVTVQHNNLKKAIYISEIVAYAA